METGSIDDLGLAPSIPERLAVGVPEGAIPLAFRAITYLFSAAVGSMIARRIGANYRISLLCGSIVGGAVVLSKEAISAKIKAVKHRTDHQKNGPTPLLPKAPQVSQEIQQVRALCRSIELMQKGRLTLERLEEVEQQIETIPMETLPSALKGRVSRAIEKLQELKEAPVHLPSDVTEQQIRWDGRLEEELKQKGYSVLDTSEADDSLLAAVELTLFKENCLEYAAYERGDGSALLRALGNIENEEPPALLTRISQLIGRSIEVFKANKPDQPQSLRHGPNDSGALQSNEPVCVLYRTAERRYYGLDRDVIDGQLRNH